jgi:type VI secretion system protein ImpF
MSLFLPCLLQRWGSGVDGTGQRMLNASWSDVRDDVLRNLEWLLNTEATHRLAGVDLPPSAQASTLCFGVPAYSGRPQSTIKPAEMAADIRQRILWFEPRLHPAHLEVRPVPRGTNPHFNTLRFEVVSVLLSNPIRDFQVRTEIDMETGEARLLP